MTKPTSASGGPKLQSKKGVGRVVQPRLVSGCSETLSMEILRNDMRITEARLSDAIDHEEGLRTLHTQAEEKVALLRSIKRDLELMAAFISSANDPSHARTSMNEQSPDAGEKRKKP